MIKRILSIYANFKWQVAKLLALIFLIQGIGLLGPYLFGKMMDSMIYESSHNGSSSYAVAFGVVCWLLGCSQSAVGYFRSKYQGYKVFLPVREFVRKQSLDRFLSFSIGQLKGGHSGVSKEIMMNGESSLINLARMAVMMFVPYLVRILITSIFVFSIKWELGAIITTGSALYLYFYVKVEKKYSPLLRKARDLNLEAGRNRSEILSGASIVISHVKESECVAEHMVKSASARDANLEAGMFITKHNLYCSWFVNTFEYAAQIMGIYMVFNHTITVGELVTVRMWWGMLTSCIIEMGNNYPDAMENLANVKKFFDLIDVAAAVKEADEPVRLPSLVGFIEFRDVSFAYPHDKSLVKLEKEKAEEERNTLSHLSFRINSGERVALVGPSGAGKSTLINLLLRGYDPTGGCILVDGINLKTISLADFRRQIAVVDQGAMVFDATLRDNILFGATEEVSEERLLEVCRLAQVDFIHKLEEGLDTRIGERGTKLSGGERQRVVIARAMIRNPRILLLDEATSSLDTVSESKIKKAFAALSKNCTTITIAHRLPTVMDSDRIFVMEDGVITSVGHHTELLQKSVTYQDLVKNQMVQV